MVSAYRLQGSPSDTSGGSEWLFPSLAGTFAALDGAGAFQAGDTEGVVTLVSKTKSLSEPMDCGQFQLHHRDPPFRSPNRLTPLPLLDQASVASQEIDDTLEHLQKGHPIAVCVLQAFPPAVNVLCL